MKIYKCFIMNGSCTIKRQRRVRKELDLALERDSENKRQIERLRLQKRELLDRLAAIEEKQRALNPVRYFLQN